MSARPATPPSAANHLRVQPTAQPPNGPSCNRPTTRPQVGTLLFRLNAILHFQSTQRNGFVPAYALQVRCSYEIGMLQLDVCGHYHECGLAQPASAVPPLTPRLRYAPQHPRPSPALRGWPRCSRRRRGRRPYPRKHPAAGHLPATPAAPATAAAVRRPRRTAAAALRLPCRTACSSPRPWWLPVWRSRSACCRAGQPSRWPSWRRRWRPKPGWALLPACRVSLVWRVWRVACGDTPCV